MGHLSDEQPKALTRLAGKSLLEWQMIGLSQPEISRIGIVKGYLAERVHPPGVTGFVNKRWEHTNMVASLLCADEWLSTDVCVVSYADIVYPPEYVSRLIVTGGDIVVVFDSEWRALWEKRFADVLSDAETFMTDDRGCLIEIGNRTARIDDIRGQYMGLLKFTPSGWTGVKELLQSLDGKARDRLDMTSLLRGLIGRGAEIRTMGIHGGWFEIDSEKDLEVCEHLSRHDPKYSWMIA